MQALILAAGKGTRLGKYTEDNTKCMLPIDDKRLIELSLDNIHDVGIDKVIIVVGYKRENLMNFLGDEYKGIKIEYVINPVYDTTNNIYSLYLAKDYLLQQDTILIESDLIFHVDILKKILNDPRESLAVVDKYEAWMDGTVVKLDDEDNITSFIPKKFFNYDEIDSYYKTVNIYKFSKNFSRTSYVPFLEAYSKALGKNEYYEQVLRVIVKLENQELRALRLTGEKWYEIDDIQDKDNAEVIFAPDAETKLKLMQKRYGGYWRYTNLKDFCYLVNPYFPNSVMKNEIKAHFNTLLTEYPSGLDVQNLLAGKMFDVEGSKILVGNGAAELIRALSKSVNGTIGIGFPTFNEYPESFGYDRVVKLISDNEDFTYDIHDLSKLSDKCDNLLLINPDNPTGNFILKNDILILLDKLKKVGKTLIYDESFIDFSTPGMSETLIDEEILSSYDNLVVIKSISKSYGIPGARLGVLVSSNQDLLKEVRSNMSIWNINSFGEFFLQIIGKYQKDYQKGCRLISEERDRFYNELKKNPYLRVIYSQANYFTCEVIDKYTATELTKKLLWEHEIFIKDLTGKIDAGKGEYVRIAVRDSEDNNSIINVLSKL